MRLGLQVVGRLQDKNNKLSPLSLSSPRISTVESLDIPRILMMAFSTDTTSPWWRSRLTTFSHLALSVDRLFLSALYVCDFMLASSIICVVFIILSIDEKIMRK